MSCPYADILGKRGQGFHERRFIGLALYDTLGTMVIAAITSYIFNISFLYSFAAWFIMGEVLHYIFGTNTAFLEKIGLTPNCDGKINT